jgi:hypothetical protein
MVQYVRWLYFVCIYDSELYSIKSAYGDKEQPKEMQKKLYMQVGANANG